MDTSENTAFCVMPWMHLYVRSKSKVMPCCLSSEVHFQPAKIHEQKDYLNTDAIRQIRTQMMAGERPAACNMCFLVEDLGNVSARQKKNKRFENFIPELIESTAKDGSVSGKLYSADFRLGNQCNLKCRMCSASNSSLWESEDRARNPGAQTRDPDTEWHDSDEFWVNFFAENDSLFSLELSGGEPLINKRFFWIVDYLIATGKSSNISLQFHTNLSFLPEAVIEKLKKFRELKIFVSLDGIGEVNSYIRFPSAWPDVEKNIAKLNAAFTLPFHRLHFHTAVQAYNAFDLLKLLEFALGFSQFQPPMFTLLQFPDYLSALILPREERAPMAESLNAFLRGLPARKLPNVWNEESGAEFVRDIKMLIRFLESEENNLRGDFLRFTQDLDSYRGQSLAQALPEVSRAVRSADER